MTAPYDDDDFATGGQAALDRVDREAQARQSKGGKVEYLSSLLKESGDSVTIRFVTDEPAWPYVYHHLFIPTKRPPADKPPEAGWPERMGAICRLSLKKNGEPFFPECFICSATAEDGKKYRRSSRAWALAVVRKEILGTQVDVDRGTIQPYQINTTLGFADDLVDTEEMKDGKPVGKKKHYIVVNMAVENFWRPLLGSVGYYRTAVDRDYRITRSGITPKVSYSFVPMDPMRLENGEILDLRNPKYAEQYADSDIDIRALIRSQMSDEYYERFFDDRVQVPWGRNDNGGSSSGSSTTAEPVDTELAEKLAKMREAILSNTPGF